MNTERLLTYVVGGFAAIVIKGYCLSILWGWFAVPLGAQQISIPIAIGLSIVATMLTEQHVYKPKEQAEDQKWVPLFKVFVGPFLTLGIGYIVKLFI